MQVLDFPELDDGWYEKPDGSRIFIEQHEQDGKRLTVVLSELTKGAVDSGFNVVTRSYHVKANGKSLTFAGYDAFRDRKWLGRFRTEAEGTAAVEGRRP